MKHISDSSKLTELVSQTEALQVSLIPKASPSTLWQLPRLPDEY